jgi:hypothetical protein
MTQKTLITPQNNIKKLVIIIFSAFRQIDARRGYL